MAHNWQDEREMSADEYVQYTRALGLNTASAGRFFGCAARTSHRYGRGELPVPVPIALLLRAFVAKGIRPKVPPWSAERNKNW